MSSIFRSSGRYFFRRRRASDRHEPCRRGNALHPRRSDVGPDGIYIAPLELDEDDLPRTTIAVRVVPAGQEPGWVVGRDCARRAVENGRSRPRRHEGFALLVAEEQRLIAHGNPNKKRSLSSSSGSLAKTPEEQADSPGSCSQEPGVRWQDQRNYRMPMVG